MKPTTLILGAAAAALTVIRRRALSVPALVLLGLLSVGLCVSGSGLVHLPSASSMVETAAHTLGPLTVVVVGAFAFLESGAFIGFVAPGELMVILGGVTAAHGTVSLSGLVLVVWVCALGGDIVSFTLGRRWGRGVLLAHGGGLGITSDRLARVETFMARHGATTIIVGRFMGLVRPLSPFVAGSTGMPPRRFLPAALLASGLWAAVFTTLGYLCGSSLDELLVIVERSSLALAVLAGGALLVARLRRGPVPARP